MDRAGHPQVSERTDFLSIHLRIDDRSYYFVLNLFFIGFASSLCSGGICTIPFL